MDQPDRPSETPSAVLVNAPGPVLSPAPGPFHARMLAAAAAYLGGDTGALERFAGREFPELVAARDRAAAALALHQAACVWLPATPAAAAEFKVRHAVAQAVVRAAAVEQHWQRRLLAQVLPADLGDLPWRRAEAACDVERLVASAAMEPGEQALVSALSRSDEGWAAVRRRLPADLAADPQTFLRWQRAARQRWQRRLAALRRS